MTNINLLNCCLKSAVDSHRYLVLHSNGMVGTTSDKKLAAKMSQVIDLIYKMDFVGSKRELRELRGHFQKLIQRYQTKERSLLGRIFFRFTNPIKKIGEIESRLAQAIRACTSLVFKLPENHREEIFYGRKLKPSGGQIIEGNATYNDFIGKRLMKSFFVNAFKELDADASTQEFVRAFETELVRCKVHETELWFIKDMVEKVLNQNSRLLMTVEEFKTKLLGEIEKTNRETMILDRETFETLFGTKFRMGRNGWILNRLPASIPDSAALKGLVDEYMNGRWKEGEEKEITFDHLSEKSLALRAIDRVFALPFLDLQFKKPVEEVVVIAAVPPSPPPSESLLSHAMKALRSITNVFFTYV